MLKTRSYIASGLRSVTTVDVGPVRRVGPLATTARNPVGAPRRGRSGGVRPEEGGEGGEGSEGGEGGHPPGGPAVRLPGNAGRVVGRWPSVGPIGPGSMAPVLGGSPGGGVLAGDPLGLLAGAAVWDGCSRAAAGGGRSRAAVWGGRSPGRGARRGGCPQRGARGGRRCTRGASGVWEPGAGRPPGGVRHPGGQASARSSAWVTSAAVWARPASSTSRSRQVRRAVHTRRSCSSVMTIS